MFGILAQNSGHTNKKRTFLKHLQDKMFFSVFIICQHRHQAVTKQKLPIANK